MGASYAGKPELIRALVREASVHRDLYISEEVFALEREHLFANTWNYIGHGSEIPAAGDYITMELAGRPLLIVRQADGSVTVLMNRCAHKGARLLSMRSGSIGRLCRNSTKTSVTSAATPNAAVVNTIVEAQPLRGPFPSA